jgi:hypothetical protein
MSSLTVRKLAPLHPVATHLLSLTTFEINVVLERE